MEVPEFLDPDAVAGFRRNGYVMSDSLFSEDEVRILIDAVETGARVAKNTRATEDASGMASRLSIWHELGDDIWTAVSTCPRIVNNIRILLGEEVAFFHGKVMFKDAHEGGAWEWHQDYGYWYNQGFVFPRMISAFIALDQCTRANGCLRVLRGSHRLGRLDHVKVGTHKDYGDRTPVRLHQLRNVTGFGPLLRLQPAPLLNAQYLQPPSAFVHHLLQCAGQSPTRRETDGRPIPLSRGARRRHLQVRVRIRLTRVRAPPYPLNTSRLRS